jgi:hypothetical protein
MALASAWKSLTSGNLENAFNYLFIPQDVEDQSTAIDSRWEQFLQQQVATGKETQEQAARTLQNIDSTDVATGAVFTNPDLSPWNGFQQGLQEGLDNESNLVKKTLNTVAGTGISAIWKALPWWVWVGAGIYGLWWIGLLGPIVRSAVRRVSK